MHGSTSFLLVLVVLLIGGVTSPNLSAQEDREAIIQQNIQEVEEHNRLVPLVNDGIFIMRKDPATALAKFQQAMDQGFSSPDLHFFIGECHAQLGHAFPALTALQRYLELDPGGKYNDRAVDLIYHIADQIPGARTP